MSDEAATALLIAGAFAVVAWPYLRRWLGLEGGMPPVAVAARLDGGAPTVLLDVRSPDEVAGGTLAGAINIPLPQLASRIQELLQVVNATPETGVVVICQSGMRAQAATTILASAGVKKMAVLKGGVAAWRKAGMPII